VSGKQTGSHVDTERVVGSTIKLFCRFVAFGSEGVNATHLGRESPTASDNESSANEKNSERQATTRVSQRAIARGTDEKSLLRV